MLEAVALDVGETLVRDDRYWATWADWLRVPRHTVSAVVGAVIAAGGDNAEVLRLLRPGMDVDAESAARDAAGMGEWLTEADLYPDVRPVLTALRAAGLRVVVAGNQTARAGELLRRMDLPVDAVATSEEWGVAKPDGAFFERVVALAGCPPDRIVYVGDRPDRDVLPAAQAGLRTAHLRRGPWGHLWAGSAEAATADWRLTGLRELLPIVDAERHG